MLLDAINTFNENFSMLGGIKSSLKVLGIIVMIKKKNGCTKPSESGYLKEKVFNNNPLVTLPTTSLYHIFIHNVRI